MQLIINQNRNVEILLSDFILLVTTTENYLYNFIFNCCFWGFLLMQDLPAFFSFTRDEIDKFNIILMIIKS